MIMGISQFWLSPIEISRNIKLVFVTYVVFVQQLARVTILC